MTTTILTFHSEIAALTHTETFEVTSYNRGWLCLPVWSDLTQAINEDITENYYGWNANRWHRNNARSGGPNPDNDAFVFVNAYILSQFPDENALFQYLHEPDPVHRVHGHPSRPRLEMYHVSSTGRKQMPPCHRCRASTNAHASTSDHFFRDCIAWQGLRGEGCMNCAWAVQRHAPADSCRSDQH